MSTADTQPTKVLFLDIDGVLNSERSCTAFGGYPHSFSDSDMARFDHVALALVRRLCREAGCAVVMSTSWRYDFSPQDFASAFNLPVIDSTPRLVGTRGMEIQAWLDAHPRVTAFAIVDDVPEMFVDHEANFVLTDPKCGLSVRDYSALLRILGQVDGVAPAPVRKPVSA